MLHRWRFQRFFRVFVPILIFLVLITVLLRQRGGAGGELIDDDAYVNLAVARTWVEQGTYGLQEGQPGMMIRDTLWRILIAESSRVLGSPVSSAHLLGTVLGIVSLVMLLRLATLLFPYPPFVYFTAGLVILCSGLVGASVSGLSSALAIALVTGAILLHVEGIAGRRRILPLSSAVLLGLAVWLRMEFVVIWLVLALHALFISFIPATNRPDPLTTLFRGVNGLLLLLLFLLPLVAWNLHAFQIPWPRLPDVPLALDAWGEGPAAAMSATMGLIREGWSEAFAQTGRIPALNGWIVRLFFLLGAGILLALSLKDGEERPFSVLVFLPIGVPLLYALFYPYVGWGGLGHLLTAIGPAMMILCAFGVFRTPFLAEGLYRKWKPGMPTAVGFRIWWGVAGGILAIACLLDARQYRGDQERAIEELTALRASMVDAIRRESLTRDVFVTDQPGWLSYRQSVEIIDLTCEFTPSVLLAVNLDGTIDPERAADLFHARMIGAALLWNKAHCELLDRLPDVELLMAHGEEDGRTPCFAMITWPGVL